MAGNHNGERKAAMGNGSSRSPERKTAKKNGRKNGTVKHERPSGNGAPAAGSLFVIGGAEDRQDTKNIFSRLAERIRSGKLVGLEPAFGFGGASCEIFR